MQCHDNIYLAVAITLIIASAYYSLLLQKCKTPISVTIRKMSGPVTEFGFFAAKPGVDVWDKNTVHSRAIDDAVSFGLSQPGAQIAFLGQELDNEKNVWLFLDWNTVDDHVAYATNQ